MFKKTIISLLGLILITLAVLIGTGNSYILTAVQRTYLVGNVTANVNDHTEFKVHEIKAAEPSIIQPAANYNAIPLPDDFNDYLKHFGAISYLVVKDNQVVSEHYFNGYNERSKTNSFSMAKTVLTLLLGIAIEEGHIKSLDQKLTDLLPEFKDDPNGQHATIGQLSLMNSGYEWTEHYYSPFSPTVELLYGDDVSNFVLSGHFSAKPGEFWEYSSASTQLLGIALMRALKKNNAANSLSDYLSRKLWQPMQMNDDALWHTDDSGMELAYCCINTNARNFAKLGLLMLNSGQWNGQQLVPSKFIQTMTTPIGQPYYGYSTWLSLDTEPGYYWFSGHLGQYIIVVPEHNMIIVRIGETRNNDLDFRSTELPEYVNQALRLVSQ